MPKPMTVDELHAHVTQQEHIFGLPPGTLLGVLEQFIPILLQLLGSVTTKPTPTPAPAPAP